MVDFLLIITQKGVIDLGIVEEQNSLARLTSATAESSQLKTSAPGAPYIAPS
jgi:hypothetical protein